MKKSIKYGALAGSVASLAPMLVKAQDIMTTMPVEDTALDNPNMVGVGLLGFAGIWLIFVLIFAAIGLALFIFWIIMLIDVFKRTNWQDESQKNLWLILMIASFFVGFNGLVAIIYYFAVKRQLDKPNMTQRTEQK